MSGVAKTRRKSNEVAHEAPDFKNRSALQISPGLWRMRNGHTAEVLRAQNLPYGDGKQFPIWVGKCSDCSEPKTWNLNGTYAAVGKHANDIIGRIHG